jgi:serine/threonine protein kinase
LLLWNRHCLRRLGKDALKRRLRPSVIDRTGSIERRKEANLTTATTSRAYDIAPEAANDHDAGPVLGRYELISRIASGGMATVWAARLRGSRGFQKIVALKTIAPRFCSDVRYERMFLDEATFAGQIRHPNVAQILDLGEDNGVLFLAMEWIDGVTVDDLLREAHTGRIEIPLPVAIRIAIQAASGLHAAHELRDGDGELVGLVHGDVSPQNIVVSFDGVTKLVDFGLAKLTNGANEIPEHSDVRGKAAYLAPEQVRGKAVDRRADLFALGVVLYMLTTGRHPFAANALSADVDALGFRGRARPPREFIEDFPSELEATILRCLERDPAQRFATSDELVWALESSLPSEFRATDQDVSVLVRCLAEDADAKRGALKIVGNPSRPPARPSVREARSRSLTSPDMRRTLRNLADALARAPADGQTRAVSRPLVLCAAFLGSVGAFTVASAFQAAIHGTATLGADCAEHAPCDAAPTAPPAPVDRAAMQRAPSWDAPIVVRESAVAVREPNADAPGAEPRHRHAPKASHAGAKHR